MRIIFKYIEIMRFESFVHCSFFLIPNVDFGLVTKNRIIQFIAEQVCPFVVFNHYKNILQ